MILLWELALTLLSPLVAALAALVPALRAGYGERLGAVVPEVEPGAVWVHAASLGEGRAAAGLLPALRAAAPGIEVIRSATSPLGRAQEVGADQSLCLPLDAPPFVAAWLDRVRPRALVLVEAELWPCLLAACRRRGIPVALVQARLGRGMRRLRALPGAWPALTRGIRFYAADAGTGAELGCPVTGDLKATAPRPARALDWGERPALVAGSTREGDEAALLAAWRGLRGRPLLVLAPRVKERFEPVWRLARSAGFAVARRSALLGPVPPEVEVVVLDSVGELAGLYPYAGAAFVGGTFDAALGGHSPSEAVAAGLSVVRGPEIHAHAARWAEVPAFVARTPGELPAALAAALATPPREPPGEAAATRTAAALAPLLAAPIPPERPLRPWLWPLAGAWLVGTIVRPRPARRVGVPVVAVGALTAGGSGKTPVAARLAEALAERRPALVSRGHGRDPGGEARGAGSAARLGDEAAMLAARGLVVWTAPDRRRAIAEAVRDGAGLVVLDDALQYGGVARDLEVVVVDARWPGGGGPIPVGTRRVPWAWLRRADVVWVHHGPLPERLAGWLRPDALVVEARYEAVGWTHRGRAAPLASLPVGPVFAFAGIARPEGFFSTLRRQGVRPTRCHVFPDHHRYTWAELQELQNWADDHVVVTTEKDAARLPADAPVWVLRVEPVIVRGEAELRARLAGLPR